jgi:hypothetical protein
MLDALCVSIDRIVDIPPLIRRDTCTLCLSVRPSFPGPDRTGLSSCLFVCLSVLHMCTFVFAGIFCLQVAFAILVCLSVPETGSDRDVSAPKMPAGKKSAGQKKPSQKQRRHKQSRLGQGVQAYAVQAYADDVPCRRLAVKSEAVKRPKAVKLEDEAASKAVKLEEADRYPSGLDRTGLDHDHDHDKAVKLEDDDHDHDMICDHDKLSHNMATLLRHAAYKEQLLDEDGWLPLSTALPRLHCTAAEATTAVEQSDRHDGLGARFGIYISGSRAWIRATDGAYYRDRSRRAQ